MVTASELPIDTSATADEMADAMFGSGVEVISASYSGAASASGIYTDGDTSAPGVAPSDSGVILSTGKAEDITNTSGDANESSNTSTNQYQAGDSELSEIAGYKTYDASVLEAEFVPDGPTLTMQLTFSSEEYLEYCDSGFNDAVGVWVNGVKADLAVGDGDISIDNINDKSNGELYVDNPAHADEYNTEMDGFTVTLTLKAPVNPGEVNSIKIGIADAGDAHYDSNLMIVGDSVQTSVIAADDSMTASDEFTKTLDVLANDTHSQGGTLTVTEINGQPVSAGDTVTLASGDEITLNADGTFAILGSGSESNNTFTYTVADDAGVTDTAFVTLKSVACFVAGTRIETARGPRAVETLEPGDMVLTRDRGPQPLRWRGERRVPAKGRFAPIVFAAGALGAHDDIALSPNHRVLLRSPHAALYFGDEEVLVAAKHLVNGTTIQPEEGGMVHYVHLLFDRHEVITANRLPSESYHPGDMTRDAFDTETRMEILALFPGLSDGGTVPAGTSARQILTRREARLLVAG